MDLSLFLFGVFGIYYLFQRVFMIPGEVAIIATSTSVLYGLIVGVIQVWSFLGSDKNKKILFLEGVYRFLLNKKFEDVKSIRLLKGEWFYCDPRKMEYSMESEYFSLMFSQSEVNFSNKECWKCEEFSRNEGNIRVHNLSDGRKDVSLKDYYKSLESSHLKARYGESNLDLYLEVYLDDNHVKVNAMHKTVGKWVEVYSKRNCDLERMVRVLTCYSLWAKGLSVVKNEGYLRRGKHVLHSWGIRESFNEFDNNTEIHSYKVIFSRKSYVEGKMKSEVKCLIQKEMYINKFGSSGALILNYIDSFWEGKIKNEVEIYKIKEMVLSHESSRRILSSLKGSFNWQAKRFVRDISYLRTALGYSGLYFTDWSIGVSTRAKRFFDLNQEAFKNNSKPLIPPDLHLVVEEGLKAPPRVDYKEPSYIIESALFVYNKERMKANSSSRFETKDEVERKFNYKKSYREVLLLDMERSKRESLKKPLIQSETPRDLLRFEFKVKEIVRAETNSFLSRREKAEQVILSGAERRGGPGTEILKGPFKAHTRANEKRAKARVSPVEKIGIELSNKYKVLETLKEGGSRERLLNSLENKKLHLKRELQRAVNKDSSIKSVSKSALSGFFKAIKKKVPSTDTEKNSLTTNKIEGEGSSAFCGNKIELEEVGVTRKEPSEAEKDGPILDEGRLESLFKDAVENINILTEVYNKAMSERDKSVKKHGDFLRRIISLQAEHNTNFDKLTGYCDSGVYFGLSKSINKIFENHEKWIRKYGEVAYVSCLGELNSGLRVNETAEEIFNEFINKDPKKVRALVKRSMENMNDLMMRIKRISKDP
jgi:hypothetical protein